MAIYLIMKNIYINPLFYVFSFIFLVTGFFKPFLFMMIYLIVHEFGHIIVAFGFGYKVMKINVYPCGLLTIFDMKINDSIIKNFLIAISGPLFQCLCYLVLKKYYEIHLFLIVFNLLPIYPLDGSKIFGCFLYLIFPYKKSNKFLFVSSYILSLSILTYFIFNFNLIYILIFSILFMRSIEFYKNRKYLFNMFILERLLYNFNFLFIKKIDNINYMYKGRYHYIKYKNNYIEEKKYLSFFNK